MLEEVRISLTAGAAAQIAAPEKFKFDKVKTILSSGKIADTIRERVERRQYLSELSGLHKIGTTSEKPFLPAPMLFGTFHKTGTVLVASLFRDISDATGTKVWDADRQPDQPAGWDICLRYHSDFEKIGISPADYPTVILVRDPRDVVISAAKYHRKSTEAWLHRNVPAFGNRTYQEHINGLPDQDARMIFEIENVAGLTIQRMSDASNSPAFANALFVRLEDLMSDTSLEHFERMFRHVGVSPAHMPLALRVAFKNSVFNPEMRRSAHITSGRKDLWRDSFSPAVEEAFRATFPGVIERLGYSW